MFPVPTAVPILSDPVIAVHSLAALLALLAGPLALLRRSRDWLHRLAGRVWVLAMVVAAASSFGIHAFRLIGPFSPIHLLSLLVLWMLWRGIAAVRARRLVEHGRVMTQVYVYGMLTPAAFTLLPGRRMHAALLEGTGWPGFAVAGIVLAGVAVLLWRVQPAALRAT